MGMLGVYVLALTHTLTAGTDIRTPWLAGLLGVTAAPILVLLLLRMLQRPPARAAA